LLFIALLAFSQVGTPKIGFRVFYATLGALGLIFSFLAFQSATLVIKGDTIVLRSFVRRTIPIDRLSNVRVRNGMVGMYEREYLVLTMDDGKEITFRSMNSPRGAGLAGAAGAAARQLEMTIKPAS
jgi:hypothetical protein